MMSSPTRFKTLSMRSESTRRKIFDYRGAHPRCIFGAAGVFLDVAR